MGADRDLPARGRQLRPDRRGRGRLRRRLPGRGPRSASLITFDQNTPDAARRPRPEAVTDSLTGLANRRALMADLERAVSATPPEAMVLALFDLDGFKAYNDSFGHPAGDDLLRRLGRQLAEASAGPTAAATASAATSSASSPRPATLSAEAICRQRRGGALRARPGLLDRRLLGQGADPGRGRRPRPTRCGSPTGGCTRKRAGAPTRPAARPAASCCGSCTSASPSWSATSTASPASPPPSARQLSLDARGARRARPRGRAARHRQDRDPRRDPPQGRPT